MTRIVANPEQMKQLGYMMFDEGERLRAMTGALSRALDPVDWEGAEKLRIQLRITEVCLLGIELEKKIKSYADSVRLKADAFAEADQQGAQHITEIAERYRTQLPSVPPIPSLVDPGRLFDMVRASASTLAALLSRAPELVATWIGAVQVLVNGFDSLGRQYPTLREKYLRWMEYGQQPYHDRYELDRLKHEALDAFDEFKAGAIKDALDVVADKLPKTDEVSKDLKQLYDTIGALEEWGKALLSD